MTRGRKKKITAPEVVSGGAIPTMPENGIMARIDKTGELLQAMLNELKRLGADEKLFAKAVEHLKLGITAAKWAIEDKV